MGSEPMDFKKWLGQVILLVCTVSFAASTGILMVSREREESRRLVAEEALTRARRTNLQLEKDFQ